MPNENEPKRDASTWTKPRQFRLSDDVMDTLDLLCADMGGVSRTDTIRVAILDLAKHRGIKLPSSPAPTAKAEEPAPSAEPKKRGRPRKAEQAERDATLDARDRASEGDDLTPPAPLLRVPDAEANASDLDPGAGKAMGRKKK